MYCGSYIAASGVPHTNAHHALVMADFAFDILDAFAKLQRRKLERGWDVTDIGLRVGLHSGPVTAGILRGGKCMYQLFGKTVYEANRMESSGSPGRIQASDDTVILLLEDGWMGEIVEREISRDSLDHRKTYWLSRRNTNSLSKLEVEHKLEHIIHRL